MLRKNEVKDYYYPADGSDELLLVDKWRDEDALSMHGQQPHLKKVREIEKEFVIETILEKYTAE